MRVVSAPPSRSSKPSEIAVSSERPAPSSSALVQIDMMSSAGHADFSACNVAAATANSIAAAAPSSFM